MLTFEELIDENSTCLSGLVVEVLRNSQVIVYCKLCCKQFCLGGVKLDFSEI